jgi:hypothetical protein
MANKLTAINQLRAKIISQGVVDLETIAGRVSKNTTFNDDEIYSMARLLVREVNTALQAGETVKINSLVNISPSMKVGGKVGFGLRADRDAQAQLNNPTLWGAGKVSNYANMRKTSAELVELWNQEHPDDLVEE